MLLMDLFLNFSRSFIPAHRGGTQDAPLVLNAKIDAGEVDDQILDFELTSKYPLELYRKSEERKHSSEIKIMNVKKALKEGAKVVATGSLSKKLTLSEEIGASQKAKEAFGISA